MADTVQAVLVLGYSADETGLIDFLVGQGCRVDHTSGPVTPEQVACYDLVVSFGYRHILKQAVLEVAQRPVLNLHIAYLPFNRGAHPNFWAFRDGTPHGVTIHHVDRGIDTGDVVVQRRVNFDDLTQTFRQTQARLLGAMEDLFRENWAAIRDQTYEPCPQSGPGTLHRMADLPDFGALGPNLWDQRVCDVIMD